MKKSLLLLVSLFLIGCENDPIKTAQTDNKNIPVDFLFEHEGCKAYRFLDGNYHYYVVCSQGSVSTSTQVPEGKTSRPEEIQTIGGNN